MTIRGLETLLHFRSICSKTFLIIGLSKKLRGNVYRHLPQSVKVFLSEVSDWVQERIKNINVYL